MIASSIGVSGPAASSRGAAHRCAAVFTHIGLASAMTVGLTPASAQMKQRDPALRSPALQAGKMHRAKCCLAACLGIPICWADVRL